ncbi:unnamed protein product, partial [Rotaria magnacalcarata]
REIIFIDTIELLGDRSVIWEAHLQRNFVVQVVLTDKTVASTSVITTSDHQINANDETDHSITTPVQLTDSSRIEKI